MVSRPPAALTKCLGGTSFVLFSGHWSRPACSHVKQLAKQAGDRVDPGRTFSSGRVFLWPDSVCRASARRKVAEMTNVQSISSPSIHSEDRAHEADHPTSTVANLGMDEPLKLDCGIHLAPFQTAYQTCGELNADPSNAIPICR